MSSETVAETKYCSNCKKDIAAANFTMHEMHCRRHLVLCEHCHEPVPRTEMEQHFNDVHAKVACSQCSLELEKDQLDAHLESECPKRQVSCEYCELEMPHSDLASHIDFCGTRTEACARCGNFIMHKDLLKHNSSNCAYPEIKPPASNANGFHARRSGHDRGFAGDHRVFEDIFDEMNSSFNPFEFEEIRRALEGDSDGRGMPDEVLANSDASAAAGEGGRGQRGRGARGGARARRNVTVPGLKKNDTRGGTHKTTTNRRSEVNRQREQASLPAIPPDMDYETMLAVQLAAEDDDNVVALDPEPEADPDPDAHLNQLISNFEKRSRQPMQRHTPMEVEDVSVPASPPPSYELAAADEDMIPCEFCGETFPAFALVHHQSVCDPLASGLWGQDIPPAAGRNNAALFGRDWSPVVSRPPAIPVINNLGSASPAQEEKEDVTHHLTDNGDHFLNSMENIMLPCEFCNELLPADSLVQHQIHFTLSSGLIPDCRPLNLDIVCVPISLVDSRQDSVVFDTAMCESNPLSTPRVMTPAAAQPSSDISPTGFRRHQFFPTSSSRSSRRQPDPTEELLAAISSTAQENEVGNIRPKKKPNVPRNARVAGATVRPGASRPHQLRGNITSASEEEQDFSLHRGSRQGQGRIDSASRTRHTLNSLLSGEDVDDDGPAGVPTREGTGPGRRPQGSRRKPPNTGASSTTTGVSSRTVVRSMQQDKRQRPQARGQPAEEEEVNLASRRQPQRERGDHLFNSSGNIRNTENQNRSRRTSNRQMPEWN